MQKDVALPQMYFTKNNCDIPVGHIRLSCHFVQRDEFDASNLWQLLSNKISPNSTANTLAVDTIGEQTAATGVTVDGVLLKDSKALVTTGAVGAPSLGVGYADTGLYSVSATQTGFAQDGALVGGFNTNGLFTDVIAEQVTGAGVTVDGVLLKDGGVTLDSSSVTQITSITTAVTLDKPAGTVLTVSSTLAAQGDVTFTVNNSFVTANSKIFLTGATLGAGFPVFTVTSKGAGAFGVTIYNTHATLAFNDTLFFDFVVL